VRLTRTGTILLGLLLAFIAANVAFWGFGLADHFSRLVQTKVFIVDAVCIGVFAMFVTGSTPFSMWSFRRGQVSGRPDAETLEKWSE